MKYCGVCPKCGVDKKLTKHHIFPCRHGGRKEQVIYICRECHDSLELLIPYDEVDDIMFYYEVVITFLNEGKE